MLEVPALKDCLVSKVDYRYPRLMIFGSTSDHQTDLVMKLHNQNKVVREFEDDFEQFADLVIPIRSWPGRARGTFTWLVEASPEARRLLIDKMKGKAYMDWRSVRIVDYVGATRCFKCQNYGHRGSYCPKDKGTCGHCAEEGHSFGKCPSLQGPARCAPCKSKNRKFDHSVKSRTCPCFIEAAKREINRTDY